MDATHGSAALSLAVGGSFMLFAGGFWTIIALGQWALAPIDRIRAAVRLPAQFSLSEFLLLLLQAQAVVIAAAWCGGEPSAWTTLAALLIDVSLLAAWWQGVQRLSRAGVRCRRRRGVFLAIVAPLACAATVAALWINGRAVMETCLGTSWPLLPWLIGNGLVLAAFLICRLLTVWAMGAAKADRSQT